MCHFLFWARLKFPVLWISGGEQADCDTEGRVEVFEM